MLIWGLHGTWYEAWDKLAPSTPSIACRHFFSRNSRTQPCPYWFVFSHLAFFPALILNAIEFIALRVTCVRVTLSESALPSRRRTWSSPYIPWSARARAPMHVPTARCETDIRNARANPGKQPMMRWRHRWSPNYERTQISYGVSLRA